MNVSIEEIQSEVFLLGKKIDAPKSLLLVSDVPVEDGTPYVELVSNNFRYLSSDRGYEIFRKSTSSLDDLLYWIISRAAHQMSVAFEIKNRLSGDDPRRLQFYRFLELMNAISESWGMRAKLEIEKILEASPFIDV